MGNFIRKQNVFWNIQTDNVHSACNPESGNINHTQKQPQIPRKVSK